MPAARQSEGSRRLAPVARGDDQGTRAGNPHGAGMEKQHSCLDALDSTDDEIHDELRGGLVEIDHARPIVGCDEKTVRRVAIHEQAPARHPTRHLDVRLAAGSSVGASRNRDQIERTWPRERQR